MSENNSTMDSKEQLENDRESLLWGVQRSIRYHDRRCRFFEKMHRFVIFVGIVGFSSVWTTMAQNINVNIMFWLALIATILFAADLVINFSKLSHLHFDLKQRFGDLEKFLIDKTDAASLGEGKRQRLTIEQNEPPVMRALDTLCHNELLVAQGYDKEKDSEEYASVRWYERITANFISWPNIANR